MASCLHCGGGNVNLIPGDLCNTCICLITTGNFKEYDKRGANFILRKMEEEEGYEGMSISRR